MTAEGEAHAEKIGAAFAKRDIEPTVIRSATCRCRDTARVAFGGQFQTDAALREIAGAGPEGASAFERKAHSLIASCHGVSPVVLVSHRPNVELLSLELLGHGDLLVGRANANREFKVLGEIEIRP